MADLSISETQFVFTYFHHYLNLPRATPISFVFPSLLEEGNPMSPYAGADLVVMGNLYIQFKMPELLNSLKANEIANGRLPASYIPFFRFDIKNFPTVSGTGQYDLLLNRASASTANIVKYVSIVFDDKLYSRSYSSTSFWYNSFLILPPAVALLNFIVDVEISSIVSSGVAIGATNDHRVCYNFNDVLSGTLAHIFSEQGSLKIQRGVSEYDFQKQDFIQQLQFVGTIETEISQLSEITGYRAENKVVPTLTQMQSFLLRFYDTFWIPMLTKKSEGLKFKI